MTVNKRVLLKQRPKDRPAPDDFELVDGAIPQPEVGQILVQNLYCSLDPAMRRWMDEHSYSTTIPIGEAVFCISVSRVLESRNGRFQPGDYLLCKSALEEYSALAPDAIIHNIEATPGTPLPHYLNLFGLTGMTAYFAFIDIGQPQPSETVLVSGAAGAVGSIVGQIAKIKGCRVVGITGGDDKCRHLVDELGFDGAINYKHKDLDGLIAAIHQTCPEGVDIYFDNVGGLILDAALACINPLSRLVECGMISQYNTSHIGHPITNIWQVVAKTATMRGFLGRYYFDRFSEAVAELEVWYRQGRIAIREDIEVGLENFYSAFMRLFEGTHQGKLILQVDLCLGSCTK